MKYLLDTSVWFRAAVDLETIPAAVRGILTQGEETFGLSAISIWEIGKKVQIGRLHLEGDLLSWLKEALRADIELLPITPEVVADAMQLPAFPNRDPADELIVATARVHRLTLLTTDTRLKGYEHARIRYFTPILDGPSG